MLPFARVRIGGYPIFDSQPFLSFPAYRADRKFWHVSGVLELFLRVVKPRRLGRFLSLAAVKRPGSDLPIFVGAVPGAGVGVMGRPQLGGCGGFELVWRLGFHSTH